MDTVTQLTDIVINIMISTWWKRVEKKKLIAHCTLQILAKACPDELLCTESTVTYTKWAKQPGERVDLLALQKTSTRSRSSEFDFHGPMFQ